MYIPVHYINLGQNEIIITQGILNNFYEFLIKKYLHDDLTQGYNSKLLVNLRVFLFIQVNLRVKSQF